MRILVAAQSLAAGGAERIVTDITRCWVEAGSDVCVVTKLSPAHDANALHPLVKRRSLDIEEPIHTPGQFVSVVLALRKQIVRFEPDFVVGVCNGHATLVAAAAIGLKCRTVGCEYTAPSRDKIGRVRNALRWIAYRQLDAVVSETHGTAGWIRRHTLARRVVVIPKSVRLPLENEAPFCDPDAVVSPERHVLLAAGRLVPEKDQASLLRAFARARVAVPDWHLVVLGEGPLRSDLEALIQSLGMGDFVHLPGRVGNIASWYQRASLFVLSSLHEGGPNVVAEALAHGLPVVSFDCDMGPRELIRDGVDGVLLEPGNVVALAEALSALMLDRARRERMAVQALEARARFSEQRAMMAWGDLFAAIKR